MFKYFALACFCLILSGCSSQKEIAKTGSENKVTIKQNSNLHAAVSDSDLTDRATNHFIDGAISEAKGDYASAILEFQDALKLKPKAGIYYSIAKNYFFLNKYPNALQNCKLAVSLEPGQIEYRDLLADIFTAASQFDSAAVVLEGIIKQDSNRVQSYYKLARIYENSKPLQAINIYNKLTDIIGPDWNVLIRVAELYEKLGQTNNAAQALKKLLSIDPSNSGVQKLLIELYQKAKMYDEAFKVVNDILQFTPDDPEARQLKAQLYLDQNDYKSAAKEFKVILEQPGVPLDSKIKIGALYFTRSLKDSTLFPVTEKIFQTINKDTADWQVKMYLGAIAISQRKDSDAIKYFNEVTKLASWNPEGWIRLGGLYFDNRKYAEAEKIIREALPSFPDNFALNLLMGLSLSSQNKNEEAIPYLKKSVALNPNDVTALSGYGITLSQMHKNEEALVYLKQALKLAPEDVNLLGSLGLIYDGMHNYTACDSVYEKALKIDSTNAIVNNNYAYSLSERGIRLNGALRMIKIALAADSTIPSYLDTMGWIYFKMDKYDLAKHYVEKALRHGANDATMLEHLGDIEFKLGNKKLAKDLWQKAYKLDVSNTELKSKIEKGAI